ncbi:acyltransferase family protein [Nocardioides sp.]|uniref:acyltransferase family protein n=1 Tax=Nocardioides sp. TaxID=35761 RepID=UPI0039E5E291
MDRRRDIQGLRAVAVGLVVAAHADVPRLVGGFIGVDVFFVVSGFLITTLLLREGRRTGTVSLGGFYARRARRILPAATVVLLATLLVAAASLSVARVDQAATDAIWSAVFLANVHFAAAGADYFAPDTTSVFQHYWSLAVEEQFYLLWPLLTLVMVRARLPRGMMLAITGTVVLLSFAWSMRVTDADPVAAYFSSPARAFEVGAGALLAVWRPRVPRRAQWLLGLVGLAGLVASVVVIDASTPFPGSYAALPVLATVALLAARRGPVAWLLSRQPLCWIGDISFSLYLWHWPVLLLGPAHLPDAWPPGLLHAVLVAVSVALATASYYLVEQPFHRRRRPLLRGGWGLVLWPVTVGVVVTGSLSATAHARDAVAAEREVAGSWFTQHSEALTPPDPADIEGSLARAVGFAREGAPLPAVDLDEHEQDVWRTDFDCYAGFEDSSTRLCDYGDTAADELVVVYGDSHAGMWLPALDELGKTQHFRVVPLIKSSCAPFDVPQTLGGKPYPSCAEFYDWAIAEIAELHPAAVVVGYRGLYQVQAAADVRDEVWSTGVTATAQALTAAAPTVVVLADLPQRALPAADCLSTPGADQLTCLAPIAGNGIVSNPLTAAALDGTGARFVDPRPLVCAAGVCPLVVGDQVVYYDDDHVTASWARLVAPALGGLIGPLLP